MSGGRIRLLLWDDDATYSRKLQEYLVATGQLEVFAFTSKDKVLEFMHDMPFIDIILCIAPLEEAANIPTKVLLGENNRLFEQEGWCELAKYQRLDLLHTALFRIYSDEQRPNRPIIGSKDARIIAVSSAAGGVGTSTIMWATALYLATALQKRVLGFTLEPLGMVSPYITIDQNLPGMQRLLTRVVGRSSTAAQLLPNLVQKIAGTGLDVLSPLKGIADLEELKGADITFLFEQLMATHNYDYIFVDVPWHDYTSLDAYRLCDRLVVTAAPHASAQGKTEKLLQGLETHVPRVHQKIVYVTNMVTSPSIQNDSSGLTMPFIAALAQGGNLGEILRQDSRFRSAVQQIVAQLERDMAVEL